MKLIAVSAVLSFATPAFLQEGVTYRVWYDTLFDQKDTPLTSVVCSNLGYNTFGDLPTYPIIGRAPEIHSSDSAFCGSCWQIIYTAPDGEIKSVFFTAIDTGGYEGYTISLAGMNTLTYGAALSHNGASMVAYQETPNLCGL